MNINVSMLRLFAASAAFCLIGTVSSFAAEKTPATPASPTVTQTGSSPLAPGNGLPAVYAILNGKTDGTLAIDTGSRYDVITQGLVKKLGLTPKPFLINGKPSHLLGPGQPQSEYVTLDTIQFGTISLTNGQFLVVPDGSVGDDPNAAIDGALGIQGLHSMAIELQLAARQVTLTLPGGLTDARVATAGYADAQKLPFAVGKDGMYTVGVTLTNGSQSATVPLQLASCAAQTEVSSVTAKQLKLKPEANVSVAALVGEMPSVRSKVDWFILGGLATSDQEISYAGSKSDKLQAPLLGLDILRRYRILIDFPAKTLYLLPAPTSAQ